MSRRRGWPEMVTSAQAPDTLMAARSWPPAPAGILRSSQPPRHGARCLPLRLTPLQIFPLVVLLLAPAQRQADLGLAAREVDLERDECQPLLLDRADQPLDLAPVQQELARAHGRVVPAIALFVGRD